MLLSYSVKIGFSAFMFILSEYPVARNVFFVQNTEDNPAGFSACRNSWVIK